MANNKTQTAKVIMPANSAAQPFDKYVENYQTTSQKVIHWAAVLLIIFGLLGLAWSIPFPYLKFLGVYNGFFNWASFLIAILVYYYYKKFPGLSFGVFFLLFLFTYGVMQVDELHKAGGPSLWLLSAVVFLAGAGLQFSNLKLKNQKASFGEWLEFMLISPIWLLHFLFKKK